MKNPFGNIPAVSKLPANGGNQSLEASECLLFKHVGRNKTQRGQYVGSFFNGAEGDRKNVMRARVACVRMQRTGNEEAREKDVKRDCNSIRK